MRIHFAVVLAAGSWMGAGTGIAQSAPANPAPCTVAPQPAPCGTSTAAKPSSGEKFPFPGEDSGADAPAKSGSSKADSAGPQVPSRPDAPAADGPGAPQSVKQVPKASGAFPFPGEDAVPALGSSSSSSNSNAGDADAGGDAAPDGGDRKDKAAAAAPQGRHLLHRVNPIGTKLQNADEREAEDLDVAHFYLQAGDLQGAYLRSKDAVKTAPEDPEAHFVLAQIALKLNKRDEAIAEYTACLQFDPDAKQAKAARKELARLKP